MTEDDDIIAAEFALGLLDPQEAEQVRERARTDAPLSLRIAWWRDQLAPLVGEVERSAPDHIWARIASQIPSNDNVRSLVARWRAGAIGAMAVAASLLVFIVTRPPPLPPAPPSVEQPVPPVVLALSGEKGALVGISYERRGGTITISPAVLEALGGDAELWIIPDGKSPVSLGVIDTGATTVRAMPPGQRALVQPGATFAITREQKHGSPDGAPHGPIIAAGKIIRT